MPRRRRRTATAVGLLLGLLALLVLAVGRARAAARDVPLSPVAGGWYVGPEFVERADLTTGEPVAGELDDLGVLAGEGFDPAAVDPAVRRFYERTADYDLRYRTTWHAPFRRGAALASRLTGRIEQLNLPGPADGDWHDLESEFVRVDESPAYESKPAGDDSAVSGSDGSRREGIRAWTRTDPATGDAVFVALYGHYARGGEAFVNVAVPLPGGNLTTVLRPAHLDAPGGEGTGVRLTTEGDGDPGLYLRTPLGTLELPVSQEFRVWRVRDETEGGVDGPTLAAVHEMWVPGRRFLTVDYEIRRGD